ncbi:MAG TPA: methyltransferase domain-containing protein [Kofleriaceae bacterium]|nr:methyltransferase domain-containing protein [Kofleriaceae bacterium]
MAPLRLAAIPIVLASACAHSAVAPRPPAAPSEAEIIARSHAVLAAYDRNDGGALSAVLAANFVKLENEHVVGRAELLGQVARATSHAPGLTQTWKDEHAYVGADNAVFIGMSIEHETGNDIHGNREYDGWYSLTWVRDHDAWKVSHWTWQPHLTSIERARAMWDSTYRQAVGFNPAPNRLLVETVRGVAPGQALDVMMGQGRNALYLASQGWRTTGFDISDEGLRRAREAAAAQHLELAAVQADADAFDFGVARWDLVTMLYAGSSTKMIERIKPSLKPGGRFVLEFFARKPGESSGFAPGQLAQLFGPGFEIVHDEIVEDTPDWALSRATLVRFVARKRP